MLSFRFGKFQLAVTQFFILLFTGCFIPSKAQYLLPIGARANSMAGATITLPDAFSVFSNPASAVYSDQNSVGVYFDHRYNITGLQNMAIAANYRVKNSRLLAGVSRQGDELLNYSRCELGLAHKIRNVSLGAGAGYHQIMISENGVARNVTIQFGGTAELTPKITYGAHVYNLLRAKVAKEKAIYYPVLMRMGFSYKPIRPVFISIEVEKDSRFDPNFKAGLEYKMLERLFVRTGFNTNPSSAFFGFGLKLKEWSFDYGLSYHNRLGLIHFIGLVFGFSSTQVQTTAPDVLPK